MEKKDISYTFPLVAVVSGRRVIKINLKAITELKTVEKLTEKLCISNKSRGKINFGQFVQKGPSSLFGVISFRS